MKKILLLIIPVLLLSILAACSTEKTKVEDLDIGEARVIIVSLEGEGAESAILKATELKQNDADEWIEQNTYSFTKGKDSYYCMVGQGGTYRVTATCQNGKEVSHLVNFKKSSIASLSFCFDELPDDGIRDLWPYTPDNS